MSIFKTGKKSRAFRPPDDEAMLSDSLVVSLWNEPSESGKPRINFKLHRVNPKDATKTFSTLTIASMFELPEALGILAHLLSEVEGLSLEEQDALKHFASTMEASAKVLTSNGSDDEEAKRPKATGGILKRLAA